MLALFYDTETSGLPFFHEPSEDPRQPHIVQLAAALVELETFKVVSSLSLIVRPEGWVIPEEVSAIHGITTEKALDVGIPESVVLRTFLGLYQRRKRIGHNEQFDARIIRIALKRYSSPTGQISGIALDPDVWKAAPSECTMRLSTPIVKLPPTDQMRAAGRHHYKSPNLSEAYKHFTGKDLVGAHDAMTDVNACIEVYFHAKQQSQTG